MKMEFTCTNDACRKDSGPYVYEMNCEAVMDVKNMAAVFCPRCHTPLTLRNESDVALKCA
jgi:uncharacterized paraquat-inducible protein A